MAAKQPGFQYNQCVNCSVCVQICPVSCIELSKIGIDSFKNRFPECDNEKCIGCSLCEKNCPMNAIVMETVS